MRLTVCAVAIRHQLLHSRPYFSLHLYNPLPQGAQDGRNAHYAPRFFTQPNLPPPTPAQTFPSLLPQAMSATGLTDLESIQTSLDRDDLLSICISLILDTGASISISPSTSDFIGPIRNVQLATLQGIASGLSIEGIGTVQYTVLVDDGTEHILNIPRTLYIPACPSRLICPRQLLQSVSPTAHCTITKGCISLHLRGSTIT